MSTRLWSTTQPSANRTEQAGRGLLDRRLIFLLGKGGVGRSTLAAALGLLAARQGRRAIVVEVSGRGDIPRLFGTTAPPGVESELAPGLWTLDVDPRQALEEYLHDQLPLRMLADVIGSSTTFGIVAAATPGLREMLTIGKIWELAQIPRRARDAEPYDVVVVDAPATGHGLALLEAPRNVRLGGRGRADRAPGAPHRRDAARPQPDGAGRRRDARARRRRRAARPARDARLDSMPSSSTASPRLHFSAADAQLLREAQASADLAPQTRRALAAALAADAHSRAQRSQVERLAGAVELPLIAAGELGVADLETLADRLEALS